MHLTQIAIKGFKSFAKKTELEFEPGITMIVGPNGSGKSNITDAIQWVLGEQSPSALRGSAMQDVIFAGSLNHKALGLSEVTLTLNNNDKSLSLDFSEVTITRRLLRNGENAYYINSTPCRLLDIYELLHDSGLGRQTHSIIGQGRLEEVVNSKPEEKRALLEEAAGVLKHKKRKERALRKLITTEDNINRAKDILREVNKQIEPLEVQVSKAKSYNELSSELKSLEIAALVKKITNVKTRWEGITDKETEIGHKLKPLEQQLNDLNQNITLHEEKYRKQAATVAGQQKLKERLNRQHLQLERLVSLHKHKEQSIQDSNLHLKEQIGHLDAQINLKQAQINNLDKQLETVKNEINRTLKAVKTKRKKSEELMPSYQQITDDHSKQQLRLHELESAITDLQDKKLQKVNELTFLAKENEKHKQAIEQLDPVIKASRKKIERINKLINENEIKINNFEDQILKLVEKKSKWQKQLKEGDSQLAGLVIMTFNEAEKLLQIAKSRSQTNIKKELAQSETALATLKQDISLATTGKETIRQSLKKMIRQTEDIHKNIAQLRGEGSKLQADLNFHSQTFEQQNQAFESHNKSIKTAAFTKVGLQQENEALEAELDSLTKEKISLSKNIATLDDLLSKSADEKQVFQLALAELNYQNKNLAHQQLGLKKQHRDIKNELDNLSKQRQKCLQKFSNNENCMVMITKFTPVSQKLADYLKEIVERFSTEQLNTDSIDAIRTLREQEKEINQKIKELETRRQQLDVDKGVLKSTLDGLADRIIQDYNLALETALSQYSDIVPDRERIDYIKRQLTDIGPVNAIAEEQFKSLSERRDFLEKQIADLLSSKTSMTKIIRAIDRKIRERLLSTFEKISVNFKQMFGRLFPGGQAELILTGEDIFESGLEIKAQPYGKSPKKLSLLSGGETALTALALLFAVYYTRPSPFYVLDEVEAALDDINLQRFIRLLKEMKTKTQFIVITHQRRTMEVADCLYGVTMQADGISKIVSQKMGKENQELTKPRGGAEGRAPDRAQA